MTKEKGMKDFTIDDLEYGADKVPENYDKDVMAYLTRNENKKAYYEPRTVSKKLKKVPEVPPISDKVAVMLANLRNRIKDEEALADTRPDLVAPKLTPQQIELKKGLSSGIGTVILDAMRIKKR
jgi:hypothetical protein